MKAATRADPLSVRPPSRARRLARSLRGTLPGKAPAHREAKSPDACRKRRATRHPVRGTIHNLSGEK